jgi:hypothetical protein
MSWVEWIREKTRRIFDMAPLDHRANGLGERLRRIEARLLDIEARLDRLEKKVKP